MNTCKHSEKEYKINLGQNIRKWRMLKGVKQEHLALHLGITKAALSNLENDKTNICLHRVEAIAHYLELETVKLFSDPLDLLNTGITGPA